MRDRDLELRPFTAEDEPAIIGVLEQAEVARWWPTPDFERDTGWVVEVNGDLAGWVEYFEEADRWYPSVALDIALSSAIHGQGYGRRVLRMVIEHFAGKGHHRFTIDPNVANERAIASYTAVGFHPVGVLRCYERNPAGGWNDALLMELILADVAERSGSGGL
jgi:aminoglycoside 6'-N-acetyltransferase